MNADIAIINTIHPKHVLRVYQDVMNCQIIHEIPKESTPLIGIHSGPFTTAELLAIGMLRLIPEFSNYGILRTKIGEDLARCQVLISTGGIYDRKDLKFDHHAANFKSKFSHSYNYKLSCAGVIYKHFGKAIISEISDYPLNETDLTVIYELIYQYYIMHIDADEYNVMCHSNELIFGSSLPYRIKNYMSCWEGHQFEKFKKCLAIVTGEFVDAVHFFLTQILPHRQLFRSQFETMLTEKTDLYSEILELPVYMNWNFFLHKYEEYRSCEGLVKFVIYPSQQSSCWYIESVRNNPLTHSVRVKLYKSWRGKYGTELARVTQIKDAIFVSSDGFRGSCSSRENVLLMGTRSLKKYKTNPQSSSRRNKSRTLELNTLFPQYISQYHTLMLSVYVTQDIASSIFIATHNNGFHADDCLAVALLQLLPQFRGMSIIYIYIYVLDVIRTRDDTIIKQCKVAVDVGRLYKFDNHQFDHHQRDFNETFNEHHDTLLSSAGLVYKHYGKEIIVSLSTKELTDEQLHNVYLRVFIEEIDANDNGIDLSDNKKYALNSDISTRICNIIIYLSYLVNLNRMWNGEEDKKFRQALALICGEFVETVHRICTDWLSAMKCLTKDYNELMNSRVNPSILTLSCPYNWESVIYQFETEHDCVGQLKFVVQKAGKNKWIIRNVHEKEFSYKGRMTLRSEWGGLTGDKLVEVSGIPGSIFVHSGLFFGSNSTYKGIMEMAYRSLEP